MKKFQLFKVNFQLALLIFLATISGCASSQTLQPDPTINTLYTSIALPTKVTDNPQLTFQPTDKSTIFPTNPVTLLPSTIVTVTPAIALSIPLPSLTIPNDLVTEILGQINFDRALNDLKRLAGQEPICVEGGCYTIKNRMTGSKGLVWAKKYVQSELINLGYSVEVQDWSREGYTDQNLIVRKPGVLQPEEEIYFVAHLDGVDSPAADDNASGAVDLLELARVLSHYSFGRTLILLFSTGEEHGALGVHSYLDQLSPSELSAIENVVDVDVIGYDPNQDGVMELWHGDHPPSLALTQTMGEIIQAYHLGLTPHILAGCG